MIPAFASLAALALAVQSATPTPNQAPPQPSCADANHAAFDFWVGEWDVYPTGKDNLVAHSRIEKLYGGCAVRENWMPLKGSGGGSLNGFDTKTGLWRQFWIGSSPAVVEFTGGPADGGKMVLTGYWPRFTPDGKDALVRQTYTPIDTDTVRQHGEASFDHGLTWVTRYDLTYRRRTEPLP
ncbi:DUF1579 family protein [Tsuneonella mangrovi]|uniref:DUF1579 family protein n=1 Tax=Tsuneonella mangrovi TaxID=1982042 RepID=UPI000BA213DD|nr:DUF1579 family protein [Tsuneonella mangrovi]